MYTLSKKGMISKYMSLEEATRSNTAEREGIDNTPNDYQLQNMMFVAVEVFDKIREFVGLPLTCSSFLRVMELNLKLGSSKTSFHPTGGAIDLKKIGRKYTYAEIFDYIRCNLEFSELIWEYGTETEPAWVHVAFLKGDNRKMVKRAIRVMDPKRKGKTKTRIIKFDIY